MRSAAASDGGWAPVTGICGRPEYVRSACEASLKRLGTDHIDIYYQHADRRDRRSHASTR